MNIFPKWLWLIIIITLGCLTLWYFSNIVICILLAGILSLINKPVFDFLKKIKIGKWYLPASVCAIASIALFLSLFVVLFSLLLPLIINQINTLSSIDVSKILTDIKSPIAQLEQWLQQYNFIEANASLSNILQQYFNKMLSAIDITALLQTIFNTTGNLFFYVFSTLFILFFFLKEENLFQKIISVFVPVSEEQKIAVTLDKVRIMLFKYFLAIAMQVSLIALYVTTLLFFFGIKNALLIGLLAGLLNIIPYLGPLIGLIVGLVLGSIVGLQTGNYNELYITALKISGVFISMQLLDNNLLQPFIFSKSTNAHPLEIFIIILAAGTLGGIGAMIIAVPAYTIIRIVVAEFFGETEWIKKLKSKF